MAGKRRFGSAHVIAMLALFVGLAGTATGLPGKNRIDRNDLGKRVVGPINVKRNAIRPFQLARNSVRPFQLTPNAVRRLHIAADAVDASKVADGSLGGAEIGANAVDASKVADGSLGGAEIGANALTGAQIDESSLGTVPSAASAASAADADAVDGNGVIELWRGLGSGGSATLDLGGLADLEFECPGGDADLGVRSKVASNAFFELPAMAQWVVAGGGAGESSNPDFSNNNTIDINGSGGGVVGSFDYFAASRALHVAYQVTDVPSGGANGFECYLSGFATVSG